MTHINPSTRRPEAVLVRGRYSYAYAEFVHGRYTRKNVHAVSALFEAMSVNERLDIYSLDFGQMWYRIWLTAERRELYNKKLAKFQTAWMRDDSGEALRQLVQASRSGHQQQGSDIRWEFPKGKRLSNREPDLNCAIREVEEEAGIAKQDYQILPGFKRRVSYVHMGVRYVNVYYVAIARRPLSPSIDLRVLDQVAEISETRWMDIEQIRLFDTPTRRLEMTVAPVFKYVKRYVRGLIPVRALSFRMTPSGASISAETFVDALSHFEKTHHRTVRTSAPPALRTTGAPAAAERRGRSLECKDNLSIGLFPAAASANERLSHSGTSAPAHQKLAKRSGDSGEAKSSASWPRSENEAPKRRLAESRRGGGDRERETGRGGRRST